MGHSAHLAGDGADCALMVDPSRRSLVGKAAGGAALIWATPVVTTLGLTPAAAASGGETWSITAERPLANQGWNNQLITGTVPVDEVCTTLTASAGNTPQMIGLNTDPGTNASYNTIDHAAYFYIRTDLGPRFYVWEDGGYGGYWTNINIGDEVCVVRDPATGIVTYLLNGVVVFTSPNNSPGTLYVDSSFYYRPGFWSGSVTLDITSC